MFKSRRVKINSIGRQGQPGEGFLPYGRFLVLLDKLLLPRTIAERLEQEEIRIAALNGEAGRQLEKLVHRTDRRKAGAFFTDEAMAAKLASRIAFKPATRIIDPTLGAGDLILAACKRLVSNGISDIPFECWRTVFAGIDQHEILVQVAKRRFLLLLQSLGNVDAPSPCSPDAFDQLRVADIFQSSDAFSQITDVLFNPPFTKMMAPDWFAEARGKVNSAAPMTSFIIRNLPAGAKIHAILPEVLRTGSHYERWRASVAKSCKVKDVVSCGLFQSADVDVFMATFEKSKSSITTGGWPGSKKHSMTLGEFFKVSVGPVVDFRDPKRGPKKAFIHPRNSPPWTEVTRIKEQRKFSGPLCDPPFVLLRRTSRPGDKWRALATVVKGKRQVAVENHLIVCRPLVGGLWACRKLAKMLRSDGVNQFLDKEMRCRHLTVGIVRRIPLSESLRVKERETGPAHPQKGY